MYLFRRRIRKPLFLKYWMKLWRRMLQDPDYRFREHAVVRMLEIQDHRTLPLLLSATEDEDSNIRYIACLALGDLHDPQAIPALWIAYTREDNAWMRCWIGVQLAILGETSIVESMFTDIQHVDEQKLDDWDSYQGIVYSLCEACKHDQTPLLRGLEHSHTTVRWFAILALDELHADQAIPMIKKLADNENEDAMLREKARAALASMITNI